MIYYSKIINFTRFQLLKLHDREDALLYKNEEESPHPNIRSVMCESKLYLV